MKPIKMKIRILIFSAILISLVLSCNKEQKPSDDEEKDPPISHTIVSDPGDGVEDIDGNFYETIVLGNGQEWMAENLRTTTCSDGTLIPNVESHDDWYSLNSPAWVYYDNNDQFNIPYGKLYNWYTVRDCSVCPEGWRVASNEDWKKLRDYLSPQTNPIDNDAGNKMKVTGNQYWNGNNSDASNESGFSAYPGGIRGNGFHSMADGGFWWSTDLREDVNDNYSEAYFGIIVWGNPRFGIGRQNISDGFSIRCIKN